MPDILELIEPETLAQAPPRRLPALFLLNLLGEYLLERPLSSYLNPLVLIGLLAAVALAALGAPPLVSLALLALVAVRLIRPCLRLIHAMREDHTLLRHGLVVTAHVIGVRACHDPFGNLDGAYLDCAIPLTRQRTSVGSVWIADAGEAMRLSATGKLSVICLDHAPGIWRLCRTSAPDAGLLV